MKRKAGVVQEEEVKEVEDGKEGRKRNGEEESRGGKGRMKGVGEEQQGELRDGRKWR